tara:strand:+ start:169 stop:345 length:177 start_codon:yes stop_codon:yes gene_type:complete
MIIKNAQYHKDLVSEDNILIKATINGQEWSVPLDTVNRHYRAILEWAKIDGNTIEDAD